MYVQRIMKHKPLRVKDVDTVRVRSFDGCAKVVALYDVKVRNSWVSRSGTWLKGEAVGVGHSLLVHLQMQPDTGISVGIVYRSFGKTGDHIVKSILVRVM